MREKCREKIIQELKKMSLNGVLDGYEVLAVLDATAGVYNKIKNVQVKEDLYEKMMLSMPVYDVFSQKKETCSYAKYVKTLPKELLKGFELAAENVEGSLADLILKTVDLAVENGYKESKSITIKNLDAYRTEMEKFAEYVESAVQARDTITQQFGEQGLVYLQTYLFHEAKNTIASQRNYFSQQIENEVKFYSNILLAKEEERLSIA